MRTAAEIGFRLRQEALNLRLYLHPPRQAPAISRLPLPDPASIAARLRGTAFASELEQIAEKIRQGRIPLLGYEIAAPAEIHWRRDYVHGRETPAIYFRRIPYLDFARAGDHKIVWELNRHQHLVAMTQAGLLTGRADLFDEVFRQLDGWIDQNPPCRGINWASALEVAFRALSWIWIQHLSADRMPAALTARLHVALYQQGCYLAQNLSIYFSPNTHLQGEALALHALGMLFNVEAWRVTGANLMRDMIRTHVRPDGGHFEQSSYYHLYATDMFLFHAVLEPPGEDYRTALKRMAQYLWALAGAGEMPLMGDDDGGRLFHPFGERGHFARATLAACAAFTGETPSHGAEHDLHEIAVWWLGDRAAVFPRASRAPALFRDAGLATLAGQDTEIVTAVRAFGPGNAGHSHAHALHFTLRHRGRPVLIDPGTYGYVADPVWRDRFRGTAAHNTIRIDGRDQADPAGPFRWSNLPETEILDWKADPWTLQARCRSRGITHERRMILADGALWMVDDILGAGHHRIEQFWHPAGSVQHLEGSFGLCGAMRLLLGGASRVEIGDDGEYGWCSPVPGLKYSLPIIRVSVEGELPLRLVAVLDSCMEGGSLRIEKDRLILGERAIRIPAT